MINVSTAFRKKLYNDERDYINALRFTLTDGTVLNVGHEHIMSNGITVDDAVGDDNKFNALGAVICNSLTVILYNNDEIYSNYVFEGATCEYTTGLEVEDDGTLIPENLDMGVYTVDSASYSDYTITLTLLDNMEQFDRPYNSLLVYPATLLEIVRDACTNCGVSLSTTSLRFPHDDYVAPVRPSSTDTTYREVLGWCATIAGCFAKCDRQGDLVFRWFDTDALENTDNDFDGGIFDSANPYATGDAVNGGTFNPWNTGDDAVADEFTVPIPYHYITNLSTQNIGVDDTVISGVSITVKTDGTEDTTDTEVFVEGTSDFMIQITDNPFITVDTAEDILDWLSTQLIGLSFRQCNVSHPNDPTIEAGDVGILWDKKGDQHNILITRVTFSPLAYQTIVCGVETPSKNQSARVTEATKAYVETRKQLKEQKNAYDLAIEELQGEIENSNGLYTTEVEQPDHSVKIYYHNKPLLAESDIQMLFSTTGFTVTANGTDANPTWYGLTVDGQFLASVIQTISLFFDYASGGTLTLGGANNGNGTLRINDASGNEIGTITNSGANIRGIISTKPETNDNKSAKLSAGKLLFYNSSNNLSAYVALSSEWTNIYNNTVANIIFQENYTRPTMRLWQWIHAGVNSGYTAYHQLGGDVRIVLGDLSVDGTKSRRVSSDNYNNRLLYCYETPTPFFGDIGEGIINKDGYCYIFIDPIFSETIVTDQYQVFLQNYDKGEAIVVERNSNYFVVQGTPNLKFGWELKAKQNGYEQYRLELADTFYLPEELDYAEMATNYVAQLKEARL